MGLEEIGWLEEIGMNGSFGNTVFTAAHGRLPTDVILRPPAALRHVAGGPTKK
jgi:hypothetical protein